MLKKIASGVLSSSKSSTYPRGYASGFDSPAALLDDLFEHPATELNESARVLASRFSLIQGVSQHLLDHCEGGPYKNP